MLKECHSGERKPFTGECEWYLQCWNGEFVSVQCFTSNPNNRPIFDPETKECVDRKTKFEIKTECLSYKECYVNKTISPFGKWTEFSCESDQHFDPVRQYCIDSKDSTCGIFQNLVYSLFN